MKQLSLKLVNRYDTKMNVDLKRTKTIKFIAGFIQDILYKEENLTEEQAMENATIYHDLVMGCIAEVEKEEELRLATEVVREKAAAELASQGITDASNATAVDMMGGPSAIDNNTIYKG